MTARLEIVQPPGFAPAKGYANGVVCRGRMLLVGGQIGWNAEQRFTSSDFSEQFAQALDNVLAVVTTAGGRAEDIAEMTIYVTDLGAYRASQKELGAVWRARLGKHYPAMALVGVAGLVEAEALVEIQAVACLPEEEPA